MKKPVVFSVLAVLLLLATAMSASAQTPMFDSPRRAEGAVMTLYSDQDLQPIVTVRAEAIFTTHQRKGFFRIGVLPMLVLEGLSIEVCNAKQLSDVLTNVTSLFAVKGEAAKAVEARSFSLSSTAPKGCGVTARLVRLGSGAEWRLQDGRLEQPGTAPISFHRATLTVAGPEAGQLTCAATNGTVRIKLLSLFNQNPGN